MHDGYAGQLQREEKNKQKFYKKRRKERLYFKFGLFFLNWDVWFRRLVIHKIATKWQIVKLERIIELNNFTFLNMIWG